MEKQEFYYDAFISYRHIEEDRKWAMWLHTALETYRVPGRLIQERGIVPRIKRVFRDEEELPASADLSKEINQALEQSRFLIVICSPSTPESRWVNAEVEYFRKLGRHDNILALLIRGEPDLSFPRALYEICRDECNSKEHIKIIEPLAADVRISRYQSRRFAKLRILAQLLGCKFDDLRQREQERTLQRSVIAIVFMVLLCAFVLVMAITNHRLVIKAEKQIVIANNNLAKLLYAKAQDHLRNKEYNEAAIFAAEAYLKDPSHYYPGLFTDYNKLTTLLAYMSAGDKTVGGVVISPDGEKIYTSHYDNHLRCWENGDLIKVYQGHWQRTRGIALTSDGKTLISGGYDQLIKLWDAESGKILKTLSGGHDERIFTLAISPDDRQIASGGGDHRICIWDLQTGNLIKTLKTENQIKCLKFSFDGKILASSDIAEGALIFWNTDTWKKRIIIKPLEYSIDGIAFSAKGSSFASCNWGGQIQFRHPNSGVLLSKSIKDTSIFRDLVFSSDGDFVIAGGKDDKSGRVKAWNTANHHLLYSTFAHRREVRRVAFFPNGDRFVTVSVDGTIKIWKQPKKSENLFQHEDEVTSMALSPMGKRLYSTDKNGTLKIWSLPECKIIKQLTFPGKKSLHQISCQPQTQNIAVIHGEHFLLFDPDTEQILYRRLLLYDSKSAPIVFSRDGTKVLLTYKYGVLRLIDIKNNKIIQELDGHKIAVYASALNADNTIIASGSFDSTVKLWETATGREITTLQAHDDDVYTLSFNNSEILASGGTDSQVKLWNVKTHSLKNKLVDHQGAVNCVKFSPDGKVLASASGDKTIKLWNVNNGKLLTTLHGHLAGVTCLQFSKNGNILFSGDEDGKLRAWELSAIHNDPRKHLEMIQKITGLKIDGVRAVDLTSKEWLLLKQK